MEIDPQDTNAFMLSTCSKEGKPSSRIMLLKGVDDKGFVFYTNYLGRKSKELIENPFASILFFFKELHRQIRIEGRIEKSHAKNQPSIFIHVLLKARSAHGHPFKAQK